MMKDFEYIKANLYSSKDNTEVLMLYLPLYCKRFIKQEFIYLNWNIMLPKKWCIKVTEENLPYLIKYRVNRQYPENISEYKYMIHEDTDSAYDNVGHDNNFGLPEITFEQFKKYVLKQDIMEKKIIGYRLKSKKYRLAAKAIVPTSVYLSSDKLISLTNDDYLINDGIDPGVGLLEQAGVLHLWFTPVYEEESYEVGNWVIRTFENGKPHNLGRIFKIDEINKNGSFITYEDNSTHCRDSVRKATTEEIKKHLIEEAKKRGFKEGVTIDKTPLNYNGSEIWVLRGDKEFVYDPKEDTLEWVKSSDYIYKDGKWAEIIPSHPDIIINGYKGEFFGSYVKFGCAKIGKGIFVDLYKMFKNHNETPADSIECNRYIKSIAIGKGIFTKAQIEEIAEYYLNK